MSSRYRSASPGVSRHCSHSHSRSLSRQVNEDHQKEQFLDFLSVVATTQSLNELPEALSESHKICGFHSALEDNDRPASFYCLLIGGVPADILADTDDSI